MTRPDQTRHDTGAPTDNRYAGFGTGDGFVVYDTDNPTAWIESDTTLDATEVR